MSLVTFLQQCWHGDKATLRWVEKSSVQPVTCFLYPRPRRRIRSKCPAGGLVDQRASELPDLRDSVGWKSF